nr:ribonuclease H-like domain-containing protein [Tanacetum cinerariifolium]
MGDEHLDTIPVTESDEFIKSGVENLIPIPSESEGIPEHVCDVPSHDNSPPLDVSKDQIEDFSESNKEFSSIDDDSFSIDDIDYVEASPLDSELVNSEVMEIVIPELGGIDDDILLMIKDDDLREKLRNVNLLISKIEALNANPKHDVYLLTFMFLQFRRLDYLEDKAIERLKQGASINVQDLETNLFWEFGKFTSLDGESLESYYLRFYKMMNELTRNQCKVTNHQVNVHFLLQLQLEWQRFVTLVKQSQELKNVSYHKLYDILKQQQHEVNEIRAEKIARVANPLALVAQQQQVYHPQTHPTQYNQNSSTRIPQAATRNRRKAIVNSPRPIYDQEPFMVDDDDDETSKDKEIDKLMDLISPSFKKIYKPTNNNLRTSSNTTSLKSEANTFSFHTHQEMDQQYPTVAKIPILDIGKFEQLQFQIQQYLQHEHYALWDVIEFGDSYEVPVSTASFTTINTTSGETGKKSGRTVTLTAEDMQKKKNDVKERTTLLLSLPDEHQLRFSKYKTARELWAAILKTFGGNETTKKTKKNLLKKQYGNFKVEGLETLEQLFNRLQVIVGQLQFMDADKFWKKTWKKISIQGSDVAGFDKSKVKCFNYHKMAHFARERRAPKSQDRGRRDNYRQGSKAEEHAPKSLMAIDEVGWDWSYMANDEEDHALVADEVTPTEFALMANTSAESKVFDNSLCSKDYKKNNDSLNSKITDLSDKLFDAKNMIYHYKLGLAQVKSRLVEYKKREVKYCKKIRTLEFRTESNNECIEILKKKLETLKQEKEGVDGKLTGLLTASKDLDNLIESQRADKNKEGLGYSAVPPPPAQIYSSPKKDFTSGDDQNKNSSVFKTVASPITPKPFIKFVKLKDSQSKSKTDETETPKKPPVKNFPPINRKISTSSRNFPTASRKFPAGSTKCSTADMGMKGKAGSSQNNINDKGYWDSGCSRHMTCNISYLSDYEPFDEGYVSFSQGGCKITGKGTIKIGKLEFKNVYFLKDLKYNLFSVSQICDNKNNVLFTDSESIVLGRDFKLLDDANILLRTPRQHNMYSIDLNNIVPHRDLTCLVAKASADECMLWHRRL